MTDTRQPPAAASARLPRAVVVIGLVSLFNDLASEMVTPLIPLLLATVLAAGPVALGLVEGVAQSQATRNPHATSTLLVGPWT